MISDTGFHSPVAAQRFAVDRGATGAMQLPLVSVMIATRNRIGELVKTLASLQQQDWPRIEVIVADDASDDGTAEAVREQFPEVRLLRFERNVGSVAARNRIIEQASGKYIIGLDDDSRFIEVDAISRVVHRMETEPDIGLISFQPIGPEFPERMTEAGRLRGEWHTASFAACGVAIRREAWRKAGPFPEFFFHMYEEPDFCLRVWNSGYRVLQWNKIIVYHEFSPLNRNERRTHRRHVRNETCSVWMRYPWYLIVPATAYRLISQACYSYRRGWLSREPRVWLETFAYIPHAIIHRQPVRIESIKISVATNRLRTADAGEAWRLGRLQWREIFSARCRTTSSSSNDNFRTETNESL